jgi:hypothetical protein
MTQSMAIDFTTMLRQAGMTAETYLIDGVAAIDKFFGKGFAKEHPELIGAFMQSAATECAGRTIAQQIRAGLDELGAALDLSSRETGKMLSAIAEPLRTKTLDGISRTLRDLAGATENIPAMMDIVGERMPKRYE